MTAAEKGTQLRSRLARVLNVPQRVRLRLLPRLRPRWLTFLSSLGQYQFRDYFLRHDSRLQLTSIHSTIARKIIEIPSTGMLEALSHFDLDQFCVEHQSDDRKPGAILLEEVFNVDAGTKIPESISWFHGTRVINPESFRVNGITTHFVPLPSG
ncbi:MAG: hypothetical protein E8D49_15245 [Nitrospira sp.]|nr:MAG: hypothetical protein E8D49_15245 [Nitrospira sp.]